MIHCECSCVCCDTQTFVLPDGATGAGLRCPSCGRHLTPHTLRPFGEAEWLACDHAAVLAESARERVSDRKTRLFACACCRQWWHQLPGPSRAAVEAAERFADGLATRAELARACAAATAAAKAEGTLANWLAVEAADQRSSALLVVHRILPRRIAAGTPEFWWLAPLIREVFGNPFRPARVEPAWLAWEGGTVPKLAESIYRDQAFDRLPVLADALEEAGCGDESILAHCGGAGPHVRGCWVLDLLLGKE